MLTRPGASVRTAGVVVDTGGRPVTDAGGRLVFVGAEGELVLDDAGTAPVEPVEATGTGQPPAGAEGVNPPLTGEG